MTTSISRRHVLGGLAAAPLLAPHGALHAQAPAVPLLHMGGFPQAPLITGMPNEPLQGLLREFIEREVAPKARLRFDWMEASSLARVLKNVEDGSMDVLLSRADVPDLLPGGVRFAWHTVESPPTVAVALDSPLREIRSPQQLAGLSLGRMRDGAIPQGLLGATIKWVYTAGQNWQVTNLRMVERHRLDGSVFFNAFSPAYLAKTQGIQVRLLPLPLPATRFYMWYSLRSDKAAIAEFDRVAGAAFRSGRFSRLLEDALK